MKQLIALIATTVALSAFAQAPAAKKEEKKAEAKPVATAPAAPATATPAKSEPAKKDAPKATPKPRHQPLSNHGLGDDDDFVVNDEVTFGRNRRSSEFGQLVPDDKLDDYVRDRLWLARMLALKRYHEIHSTT